MLTQDTHCDVLVVGGGVAGVVAALASARNGARTILLEKQNVLGGVGGWGMLRYICGLYLNGKAWPSETLNGGIVREIVSILNKLSPQKKVTRLGKVFALPYSWFALQYGLSSLCLGESNLNVLLNTTAIGVGKNREAINRLSVYHSAKQYDIYPEAVVDCTGNGEVSVMAGAAYDISAAHEIQLAAYTILLKGLRDQDAMLSIKVPYCLALAVKENILPPVLRFSSYSPGDAPDEGYCKLSINGAGSAEREQEARQYAIDATGYLSRRLSAFKAAYIAGSSMGVMDRESRRICGEFTLTEDDVLGARKFQDGVLKNSWPIEIWDKNKGTLYKYLKAGDYYEIPFRCLKVKDIHNLLCAGRIISVSHEAYASTRVMGTCMVLGEQAGQAAAYWVKHGNYHYAKTE